MADFSPTYIATDQFSIPGDVTYYFPAGIRVKINCSGSVDYSSVESSSYSGGITTVTLTQHILSDPVTTVEIPPNHPQAVALHTHVDDDSGGSNVYGTPPDHSWSGTSLRFYGPSGWGDYTDLEGPQGDKGDTGDTGPAGTDAPQNAVSILSGTFDQSSSAFAIGSVNSGDVAIKVEVIVSAAASGGSPTLSVGWSADHTGLVDTAQVDLTEAGTYEITPMESFGSTTSLVTYISADSQTFSGTVYVWYGEPL